MYCLCCGKELTKKTGKFCNSSCAAKYNNAHRKLSLETKEKISKTISEKYSLLRETGEAKTGTARVCIVCGKEFMPKRIKNYRFSLSKTCSDECSHILRVKNAKESAELLIKEGRHKTWKVRPKNSYAETYWIDILQSNNINFIREYHFERYFLDFYIEKHNLKIDLEIDGKQHDYPERIKHDKERDQFLSNKGFLIYRIKWNELKKEEGKIEMQNKIQDFLSWYNNL